jgi:hypothetical protein
VRYRTGRPDREALLKSIERADVRGLRLLSHDNVPLKVVMACTERTLDEVQQVLAVLKKIDREARLPDDERIRLHLVCDRESTLRALRVGQQEFDRFLEVNRYFNTRGEDVWMQDWGEIAMVSTSAEREEKLVVFDTNRGRSTLADLPAVLARMWSGYYFRKPTMNTKSCGDYGGNIEVTPDDVLFVGSTASQELRDILAQGGYADRMAVLDTGWLMVGHVDEFVTTVPAAASARGYSILKADPELGLRVLAAIPREKLVAETAGMLERLYKNKRRFPAGTLGPADERKARRLFAMIHALHAKLNGYEIDVRTLAPGLDTDELARCGDVVQSNRRVARKIEDEVARLAAAVRGASDDPAAAVPVASVPALFEPFNFSGRTIALLPGAANLVVLRDHVVVPDPLLPSFRDAIGRTLRDLGVRPSFVRDASYHFMQGQLHCGTNVFRHPHRFVRGVGRAALSRRLGGGALAR